MEAEACVPADSLLHEAMPASAIPVVLKNLRRV
jgi:hypothetical protein